MATCPHETIQPGNWIPQTVHAKPKFVLYWVVHKNVNEAANAGAEAMQQRTVQDLLRQDAAEIVSVDASVREAALLLIQSDSDLLLVRQPDGSLAGVVCESSIVRSLLSGQTESQPLASLLVSHVESVRASASLNSVVHLFRIASNTSLPVIDDQNQVRGLLHRRDVIASMLGSASNTSEKVSASGDFRSEPEHPSLPPRSHGQTIRIDRRETDLIPGEPPDQQKQAATESASSHDDSAVIPLPSFGKSANSAGSHQPDSTPNGPYFLRGKEAQRRLRIADPGPGGKCDPPWSI